MRERVRGMISFALTTSVGCGLAATSDVTDLTGLGVAAEEQPAIDAGAAPVETDAGGGDQATADGGNSAPEAVFPCDVAAILQDQCLLCHGDPPFRAPMPLAHPANFQGESWGDPEQTMIAAVKDRITSDELGRKMPPASLGDLPEDQLKTLTAWLSAGAKPAPAGTVCPPRQPPPTDDPAATDDGTQVDPSVGSDPVRTDDATGG